MIEVNVFKVQDTISKFLLFDLASLYAWGAILQQEFNKTLILEGRFLSVDYVTCIHIYSEEETFRPREIQEVENQPLIGEAAAMMMEMTTMMEIDCGQAGRGGWALYFNSPAKGAMAAAGWLDEGCTCESLCLRCCTL